MNFGKASDHDAVVFLGLVMGIVRGNLFFMGMVTWQWAS